MKKKLVALTVASVLSVPFGTQAATVSSAGTLVDLTPPGNAVGTDIADLDAEGVGTDGFIIFNSQPEGTNVSNRPWDEAMIDSSPAYVTGLDGSASASSGGWANYDDVTVGGNNYNTGGIVQSPGDGLVAALFSFDLAGAVPPSISLGLLVDNSDSLNWDVTNVRVDGPGGITANQDVAPNGGTDLVRFDIVGGAAGETYTVFGTSPPSGALIGAVSFDSIPEPASIAFLASGVALVFLRRRRSLVAA